MSRKGYQGPKLPQFLLDRVQNGNEFNRGIVDVSRKDRRKAERQQKKAARSTPRGLSGRDVGRGENSLTYKHRDDSQIQERRKDSAEVQRTKPEKQATPLKSILKKVTPPSESGSDSERSDTLRQIEKTRNVKTKRDEDDLEIAELEKKLGIKGKKSKALELDGLNWIVEGSEADSDDGMGRASKRKRPEDAKWLRDKRFKATASQEHSESVINAESSPDLLTDESDEDDVDVFKANGSEIESFSDEGIDEFEGFGSEEELEADKDESPFGTKRQRENPYVPPVSKDLATPEKYIPPSLRKPASSDEEALRQLRRQLQGLLNRLSEANVLSILQSLEQMYARNPRQHVTSTLVDLLVGLVSDSTTLNDSFLILHAAFSAVVYKAIGTDFGAYLLEQIVEAFDKHHDRKGQSGKQALNLLAFVSCLYTFQTIGSALIFDYIRLLLVELSESNTELLLRVVRVSGQQLRSDDPSSLKDIVLLLQRSVADADEEKLSVRTKFMIETINDLKNNRMKGGAAGSAIAAEQFQRMKKMIGSLNRSQSRKATEPLRITLSDIRDSDKKGKWWLVGASYLDPMKHSIEGGANKVLGSVNGEQNEDAGYESETPGAVNLSRLARAQGMNTEVRRAIFVTLLSSSDHEEARLRLLRLNLKGKQLLQIPRVLIHCAKAEHSYNPFYAILARHFCSEHKMRKAFQFALWDAFEEMDAEDEDANETATIRGVVNLAKLYGNLIGEGALNVRVLKKLDFTSLPERTSMFVEVLLTTVFLQLGKKDPELFEKAINDVFGQAAGMLDLLQGLHLFLENVMQNTKLGSRKKGKSTIEKGRVIATESLLKATESGPQLSADEDDDSET